MLGYRPGHLSLGLAPRHGLLVAGFGLAFMLRLATQRLAFTRYLTHVVLGRAGCHLRLHFHGLDLL